MIVNESLKSLLLQRKPLTVAFKLPMSVDAAAQYLYSAIAAEVEYRNGQFKESEELNIQVSKVAEWLCGNTRKNCLFLAGLCGNGKTTFVYAIQNLLNQLALKNPVNGSTFGVCLRNAKDLANICKGSRKEWQHFLDKDILAIDDLGTEPREILEYGNVLSPIIDLITYRYEHRLPTIITTNLTPDKIKEVYGVRIADRMKETAIIVPFSNPSYRG